MQPDLFVELQGTLTRYADAAAKRMIVRIGIRYQGIEAVIAALELDQQQDAAPRLLGEHRTAGQHHSESAGAKQKVATIHDGTHFN